MISENTDLEDFFENGEIALHIVGSDGTILRANRAELEFLGHDAKDYVGRHIAEFHADQPVIEDILARLARGEKLSRYPARLRTRDGSIRHVEITSSGCFRDGAFVSTRCFTLDVTAARLAEERREADDHRWRTAFDALPAAIYITDAEGSITYFNEAAVELSGRRPKLGSDQWCVTWRLFRPDGTPLPHDECPMAISLKENRPVWGEEAIAERPDGSRVLFQPYPTPLHDKSGNLIGAVNLLMDVTQQRKAEEDAARLAAIVLSSNDAIVSKTLKGVVTSWNEAASRIFGYSASEMVGQPVLRLIPPELHDEEAQILSKLRRGERIEHYDTVRVTKDGRRINVSLSVSPVKNRAGKLIGASKVARDVTQRKQAEETQKLLVGELNHRVKNSLATVQSIASQTLRRARSPAEFVPSFLGRLQSLAGAHTLLTQSNWQGAELSDLLRSQVLADGANDERITWTGPELVLEPQLALHMALVLHELGTNARKHGALSAPRGRVKVSWTVQPSPIRALHLEWTETGGPPIYLESQPAPGFGMGLIERSMRSVEGGEAQMRFAADGVNWAIRLPIPMPTQAVSPTARHVELAGLSVIDGPPGSQSGQRILVIEDEPIVAMDIAATLEDAGFQVIGPVGVLDDAMRLTARAQFDGVLLDANLGGKPVDELAAALTRRNIPFAFVTGYGRESLPQAFAAAPMLAKPFDAVSLLGVTRRMLSAAKGAVPIRRDERS